MTIVALLLALGALQVEEKQSSKDPEIREIDFEYKDASLTAVLADLQKRSGIPIEMDERARQAVDPDKVVLTTTIRSLCMYKALSLAIRHLKLRVRIVDHRRLLITVPD